MATTGISILPHDNSINFALIIGSRHSTKLQRLTANRVLKVLATLFLLHRQRKGGARGARAPPTFTRGVLNIPILDQLLYHRDHVIITSQRIFLGAFSLLLFWATLELQRMILSSASGGCAPDPASRIYTSAATTTTSAPSTFRPFRCLCAVIYKSFTNRVSSVILFLLSYSPPK